MREASLMAVVVCLGVGACSSDEGGGGGRRGDGTTSGDGGTPTASDGGATGAIGGGTDPRDGGTLPVPGMTDGCGLGCNESSVGSGGTPFDPAANPSENVDLDADGALVLRRGEGGALELIWVANTREYSVSKIDTRTFTELGRYRVPGINPMDSENGPSRTSVDSDGNVYAGARMGTSITKISAAGDDCPDTNGDGMVTTSGSAGDLLAEGQDDCVIWSTDIGHDARGVAVQEIPAEFTIEQVPDGDPIITEIPAERYVWVSGQQGDYMLHKIDAETGAILFSIKPPTAVYGLALDGRGNLWMSGRENGYTGIGRVDTTRCIDASCASEPVCVTTCVSGGTDCPSACDSAVLEYVNFGFQSYGVTVDCKQRVWVGHAHSGFLSPGGVTRYDPTQPAATRRGWIAVSGNDANGINGIAADGNGFIWGAGGNSGVWRIDGDTLQFTQVAGTGGSEFAAKGMAIDREGKVWAIPLRGSYAMVITPGAALADATVQKPLDILVGPYTYSDMTGEQRRLAANEPGFYRQLFEGCAGDTTQWADFEWDVEAPDGTVVVFRLRTADSVDAIEQADWFSVTVVPGGTSPLAIEPFIAGAMQEPGKYVEIEVRLFTDDLGSGGGLCGEDGSPGVTPRVKSFALSYRCMPVLD